MSNFAILVYTGKERQMWVSAHSIRSWGHQRPPRSLSTAAGVGSPRALLEDLVSPKWGPCPWTSSAGFSVSNWPASLCWSPWWWCNLSRLRSGMSATFTAFGYPGQWSHQRMGDPLPRKKLLVCSCPSLLSHEEDAKDQLRKERPSSAMKDEERNSAGFSSRLTWMPVKGPSTSCGRSLLFL